MGHGCRSRFFGPVHEERQRDENRGEDDHDPDDVDIGEQASLDLGHAVDLRASMLHGVRHRRAALPPCAGKAGAEGVEWTVAADGVRAEHG